MNQWIAKLASKKVFIWDFDGCFADTERLHFLAYAKSFAEFGHCVDETTYYENFSHFGLGAKKEIETFKLTCSVDEIAFRKARHYWSLIANGGAKVFPEMEEIIKLMKQRGQIAIASNSPKEELVEILEHNLAVPTLDLILGLTPGLLKKPAPDLFLKTLEILGADANDAVIFEDSDRGLAAAHASGCEAIWIQTPYNALFETSWPHIARITHAELLRALLGINL